MALWRVRVAVDYDFEVEADTKEEAEKEGWNYEDYRQFGSVDFIRVELISPKKSFNVLPAWFGVVMVSHSI